MSQARSTQTATAPVSPKQSAALSVPVTSVHKVEADGVQVFYREAGDPKLPDGAVAAWLPNILLHVSRTHSASCQ